MSDSLFKKNYEWLKPRTGTGKNKRNKRDGKPSALAHFSTNERRIEAIRVEGTLAWMNGIARDTNPKVSNQSREAWFQGWDAAMNKGVSDD